MKEIYKPIPNFKKYHASNFGNIKTFNWKGSKKEAIMKPCKNADGYLKTILINDNGRYCSILVHRIIAITFIENISNKPHINHINGKKDDNRIENLEWCTHSENISHAFKIGLQSNKGSKNPFAKLNEQQIIEIRKKFKPRKYTRKMLSIEYGVAETTIKDVILRSWKHI
jgi:hypothetical protein